MEIDRELHFSVEEAALLDMHSVLNILNVIGYELLNLESVAGEHRTLSDLRDRIADIANLLRDPAEAHRQIANVDTFIRRFEDALSRVLSERDALQTPEVEPFRTNIRGVFSILRLRAKEIVARHRDPDAWVRHDIADLRSNFISVFRAMELNSREGFSVVFDAVDHNARSYLVDLDFSGSEDGVLFMPAIFQDVMRDMMSNARKYTSPGGRITAGCTQDEQELRFTVTDTGVGIPTDEIDRLVSFGTRGSNVLDRRTMGGGFGLTKAYYVTRRFKGRMWIDSPVDDDGGTRIEIRIPLPAT